MKRKVVQHGPSTLTVSLPAKWVQERGLKKGDEILIEQVDNGLFLSTGKGIQFRTKEIDVSGKGNFIPRIISAMYKKGCDNLRVTFEGPRELEKIHDILSAGCIGFEIIDEKDNSVNIRTVSEPSQEEFKTLFRRIFYFLLSVADEGLDVAKRHDSEGYDKLVLRDVNINKLADFCRRVVNKRGQNEYHSDTALYHIIEQLEKIGDDYGAINVHLRDRKKPPGKKALELYKEVNKLLHEYDKVFFGFNLAKMTVFVRRCKRLLRERELSQDVIAEDAFIIFRLESIAIELFNLIGATLILRL